MLPALTDLLQYKNEDVLNRYRKEFADNQLSAEDAFREVLKYLWLSEKHRQERKADPANKELNFSCAVYPEMTEIDDMWHTFILFTKDYTDFGQKYFGYYMHHSPNTHKEEIDKKLFEKDLTLYLSYVYDHLGEETLWLWFNEPD